MTRADILAAFESRVENTPEDEFRTALDNVHRIARIRLDALARQA
ncbi:2-oxo-4-hydroxy-4-carboxy-5-ureidoimidazoline decarboxylase [Chenggangzhangella methanolivorans]